MLSTIFESLKTNQAQNRLSRTGQPLNKYFGIIDFICAGSFEKMQKRYGATSTAAGSINIKTGVIMHSGNALFILPTFQKGSSPFLGFGCSELSN
ncbi:MAG: hypothetical protein BWY75_01795 [bacterium ADurb.Bin425]|nr:MAG: hypothetical protein BWY75_01795 [bacterium ADurb.Bin425]